ncbi:GxxExxY protein [soil metagenome]
MKLDETNEKYSEQEFPLQELTGKIIGLCMEVHKHLGHGFLEVVYQDAVAYELQLRNINYEMERKFTINYRGKILPHYYIADFVIADQIILELKAQNGIVDENYKQLINYLAVSKCPIGLLINFGETSLRFKRIILTK